MILKKGVKVQDISTEMVLALVIIEPLFKDITIDMRITSVRDGVHSVNSKHKLGQAVDLGTRNTDQEELVELTQTIRASLTDEYFVLLESNHIHIQFNGNFIS